MNRNTAQQKGSSKRRLPAPLEQLIAAYVDVVCAGQLERNKIAARVGRRLIIEKARKGARR